MGDTAEDTEDATAPLTDQQRHEVVEVTMSTVITLMREMIDSGEKDLVRDKIAQLAHVWPMVCTASATIARQDESYPVMIYYERVRLNLVTSAYFFDGMPAKVVVMGAPIKLELPAQQMSQLLFDDVVADRANTITKLEGAAPGSVKRTKLAQTLDGLPDVSVDVPLPARLFLSRMRSMCQGLRASQPEGRFRRCDNRRCCTGGRFFYTGDMMQDLAPMLPDGETTTCLSVYWRKHADLPTYSGPDARRFCSKTCCAQWQRNWHDLMPDSSVAWCALYDAKEARSSKLDVRVHHAFDSAVARNAAVARAIDKRKKQMKRKGSCISRVDFEREMGARVDMLNIDTGVLYAATLCARLPCRRESLVLPGERSNWRHLSEENHRNALLRVGQLYRQNAERRPIHDLLDTPAFFRAIRSGVTNIFK
jgi:hypothetical protein